MSQLAAPVITLLLHDAAEGPETWAALREILPGRSIAVDLRGAAIDQMPDVAGAAIRALGGAAHVLVGRGTGGAVAAALARQAEDGAREHGGLARLVLVDAALGRDDAWSRRVGVLLTPALLLAEAGDADRQASEVAPHFARVRLRTTGPLATFLAAATADTQDAPPPPPEPAIDAAYAALIASDRVTARTRAVLHARAEPPTPSPVVMTPVLLAILRAVVSIVLPIEAAFAGDGGATVDIARRLDAALASEVGDGWRHASLPPDPIAMVRGLRTIDAAARSAHGRPFLCLDTAVRAQLVEAAEKGEVSGLLDGAAIALWMGDLKREAVRTWMSHPAVLGRLGYSGIGSVGGDGPVKRGFAHAGPDSREAWEPRAW